LRYVLGNHAHHLGKSGDEMLVADAFSSATLDAALVHRAHSWLLREGWTRAGPL